MLEMDLELDHHRKINRNSGTDNTALLPPSQPPSLPLFPAVQHDASSSWASSVFDEKKGELRGLRADVALRAHQSSLSSLESTVSSLEREHDKTRKASDLSARFVDWFSSRGQVSDRANERRHGGSGCGGWPLGSIFIV